MNDTPKIRVLTVDDHELMRRGICDVISTEADMTVVAEAGDGREALVSFRRHRPDVTLMDVRMEKTSGIDATSAIKKEFPSARIIILTTYRGDALALRAFKAGAAGYLLKNLVRTELIETIRSVHAGRRRVPSEIAADMAEYAGHDAITDREIQVLRAVAGGYSNRVIAADLFITEHTVKGHLKNIMSKLNASDRTHAVMIAMKRGFFEML